MRSLSYKITNILLNNEIIKREDYEIYRYGFELLMYFTINVSIALFIGVVFDRLVHTIIFLGCYCTLRQFTGGYHARNYTECTLTFALIYLVTIFTANYIYKHTYILILLMIISIGIIYKLAPLEHINKSLNENEKKIYRKIVFKILGVIVIIFAMSIILNVFVDYFIYSALAVTWISTLLIFGYYIN